MAGASVRTTFGACLAGRGAAAADVDGPAPSSASSSPCSNSSVRLMACKMAHFSLQNEHKNVVLWSQKIDGSSEWDKTEGSNKITSERLLWISAYSWFSESSISSCSTCKKT